MDVRVKGKKMWEKIIKFNLEIWKMYYQSCLRIIDKELENMEMDLKYSKNVYSS